MKKLAKYGPDFYWIQWMYSYFIKLLLGFLNICSQFLFLPITGHNQFVDSLCLWTTI